MKNWLVISKGENGELGYALVFDHTRIDITLEDAIDLHDDLGIELQCESADCPCWEAGQSAMADAVQPLER